MKEIKLRRKFVLSAIGGIELVKIKRDIVQNVTEEGEKSEDMTVEELRFKINGMSLKELPETMKVDAETYGNVCQYLFKNSQAIQMNGVLFVDLAVGKNRGVMFKGIELLLETKKE